jgi:uncharacterized protein YqjF (DUF2071 family)
MKKKIKLNWLNYFIALVWVINGLFCKVLNLVPRHQQIVERILGNNDSRFLTVLIGFAETGMAVWILAGIYTRLNAVVQIIVIGIMNILEFLLAPDLLLWGRGNAAFAFMFMVLIYYNEFTVIKPNTTKCMFSFLKNHPFDVQAFFESSLVLTFAVPKEKIQQLIPDFLQLDTFNDRWAFIAVAMVQTKNLRPTGFPKILGTDFFLIGYRVFVRYINNAGKNLRGLYILKSETNKKRMEFFGNIFTHYNYTTTDIEQTKQDNTIGIVSKRSGFKVLVEQVKGENISLPTGSPFRDWKEARRFAGPLPFTFTGSSAAKKILIIEGVRENWEPKPLRVIDYNFPFLQNLKIDDAILANAFIIENVPYYWKKGKVEQWKKKEESSKVF